MTNKWRPTGPVIDFTGHYWSKYGGYTYYPTDKLSGMQWTSSEGHPFHLLGKTTRIDIGGPFESRKIQVDNDSWEPELSVYPGFFEAYHVPMAVGVLDSNVYNTGTIQDETDARSALLTRTPAAESFSTLDAWGSSVINSVLPTNPTADLAISLGEFVSERQFFRLPGTAGSLPGEYLNYMFGIAPTVALVQDLKNAISDQEEILGQYIRDSGKLVRRRWEPDADVETSKTVSTGKYPKFFGSTHSAYLVQSGKLTTTTRTRTKLWFSGAFTYYLPKEGLARDIALMDRLYGVVPGSALVWELLPYSWLLDYKLSIGSVLGNIDAFAMDGLVMPYAYVMRTQETEVHYIWEGNIRNSSGSWTQRRLSTKVTSVTKQRRAATPFGFGVLPGDLTPRQLSIIAALGLTKLDK